MCATVHEKRLKRKASDEDEDQIFPAKRMKSIISIRLIPSENIQMRREIDGGGQGAVVEVELKPHGDIAAMKMILKDCSEEQAHPKYLYQEICLLAQMHHPNIISFLGVAAQSVGPYGGLLELPHIINVSTKPETIDPANGFENFVVEYMPGGDLRDAILKDDQDFIILPWRSRVAIASQVAEAMEYIHSMGIIHFDLKANNLLLDLTNRSSPVCKICDFGFAAEKQEDMSFWRGCGTDGHMAPELVHDDMGEITEKVDVYAFGVLMNELMKGKLCENIESFDKQTAWNTFYKDLVRLAAVPEWCYNRWGATMEKCLSIESSNRPAFTELAATLRDMVADLDNPELKFSKMPSWNPPIPQHIISTSELRSISSTHDVPDKPSFPSILDGISIRDKEYNFRQSLAIRRWPLIGEGSCLPMKINRHIPSISASTMNPERPTTTLTYPVAIASNSEQLSSPTGILRWYRPSSQAALRTV